MAKNKHGPSLTEPAPKWMVKVGVGMVLIIAVVTITKLLMEDASESTGSTTAPSVTALTLPDTPVAKCRVPSVEVLKSQSIAFDGTVTGVDERIVTLRVGEWFKGDPATSVTVEAAGPQMQLALSGVEFAVGKRYLVSASDGQVTLCGFSAPYGKELAGLYEQAYAA